MSDTETRRVRCRTCGDTFAETRPKGGECCECALLHKNYRAVVRQLSQIVDMLSRIADRPEGGYR